MNWEAVGAVGEVIGAAAVVATLIYLTVQVRYAKHQLEINGVYSRAQTSVGILLPILNDPEIASLLLQVGHPRFGDFGLEAVDAQRVGAFCHMWMQVEQANHHMLPEGTHDELPASGLLRAPLLPEAVLHHSPVRWAKTFVAA